MEHKMKDNSNYEKLRRLSFSIAGSKSGARNVRGKAIKKLGKKLNGILSMNKYSLMNAIEGIK